MNRAEVAIQKPMDRQGSEDRSGDQQRKDSEDGGRRAKSETAMLAGRIPTGIDRRDGVGAKDHMPEEAEVEGDDSWQSARQLALAPGVSFGARWYFR